MLLIATAALLTALLPAILVSVPANAGDSTIKLLAIDVDPAGSPANTADSLGSIERCTVTSVGGSLDIDLVVDAIPDDRPLVSFQYNLIYDPDLFQVAAINNAFLLAANGGFQPFEGLSDPLPDTDGDFLVAILDLGTAPRETGPGVLSRITLQAVGSGVGSVSLAGFGIVDDQGTVIPIDNADFAAIAVGTPCPAVIPEPSPVPAQPGGAAGTGATPGASQDGGADGPDTDSTTGTEASDGGDTDSDTSSGEEALAGGSQPTDDGSAPPEGDQSPSDSDGDGFPLWVIAPIIAGLLALSIAGFLVIRYRRTNAT